MPTDQSDLDNSSIEALLSDDSGLCQVDIVKANQETLHCAIDHTEFYKAVTKSGQAWVLYSWLSVLQMTAARLSSEAGCKIIHDFLDDCLFLFADLSPEKANNESEF